MMTGSFSREEQSAFEREASLDPSPVSLFTRDLLYDEPRSEGYDEFFDPPLESKYECPICLFGLREPVQTSCGHRFCRGCILRSIRDACAKCPVDNEHLNESQLYPDNFAKREMLSHDVFCRLKKQHGCPWKGPLSNLEGHMKECEFVDISCPKECGKQMKKRELKKHLEAECPNRTVPCDYCKAQVIWNRMQEHHQSCPKYPLTCEGCGKERITREMMKEHLEKECPNTEINCPFNTVGCSYKGLRAAVNKHVQEHLTSHLIDMTKAFADLRGVLGIQSETQAQRTAPRRTRDGTEVRPQEQASQEEFFRELSTQSHQHQGELDDLRHLLTNLNNTVDHLKRCLEEARMRQERSFQELIMRYERQEQELYVLSGRVCMGKCMWFLNNCLQHRYNAVNEVETQLYSPAFYTSLEGYKLCMRICLNGVDSGVGTHVSLFVHMMQGENDDDLEWPFKERIKLSIVDQSGNDNHDGISATLHPVRRPEVFGKPTQKRSPESYGFPNFAPIGEVFQMKYIKNNTIFVYAQVLR